MGEWEVLFERLIELSVAGIRSWHRGSTAHRVTTAVPAALRLPIAVLQRVMTTTTTTATAKALCGHDLFATHTSFFARGRMVVSLARGRVHSVEREGGEGEANVEQPG